MLQTFGAFVVAFSVFFHLHWFFIFLLFGWRCKNQAWCSQRGREMERWGRVYSFSPLRSFLLQSSDRRWVSRSALPVLDRSLPGFHQTAPLCLGKHERELIVFKVPWQASDAHGHQVFISASAAGNTASTHCLSAHVSAAVLPDAKWAMKRCFIGQWLGDLWDHHNNTLHSTLQCHLKGCIDGLVISSAVSVSTHPEPQVDKKRPSVNRSLLQKALRSS